MEEQSLGDTVAIIIQRNVNIIYCLKLKGQ